MPGKYSVERLVHFQCESCRKWWSIGDADPEKRDWFCPWCGKRQGVKPASGIRRSGEPGESDQP